MTKIDPRDKRIIELEAEVRVLKECLNAALLANSPEPLPPADPVGSEIMRYGIPFGNQSRFRPVGNKR
jgi:hypothetical protein